MVAFGTPAEPPDRGANMDEKQMTKTEARAFIKRAREALRDLDWYLDQGGTTDDWTSACNEAIGSVAHVAAPVEDNFGPGPGIKGIGGTDLNLSTGVQA